MSQTPENLQDFSDRIPMSVRDMVIARAQKRPKTLTIVTGTIPKNEEEAGAARVRQESIFRGVRVIEGQMVHEPNNSTWMWAYILGQPSLSDRELEEAAKRFSDKNIEVIGVARKEYANILQAPQTQSLGGIALLTPRDSEIGRITNQLPIDPIIPGLTIAAGFIAGAFGESVKGAMTEMGKDVWKKLKEKVWAHDKSDLDKFHPEKPQGRRRSDFVIYFSPHVTINISPEYSDETSFDRSILAADQLIERFLEQQERWITEEKEKPQE